MNDASNKEFGRSISFKPDPERIYIRQQHIESKGSVSEFSLAESENGFRGKMRRTGSVVSTEIGSTIFTNVNAESQRQELQQEKELQLIFPWSKRYKAWWAFTIFATAVSFFYDTYQTAFLPGGLFAYDLISSIIDYSLISIFLIDIVINFNMAYYNEDDEIVIDKKAIVKHYMRCMLWIDLIGVFPFYGFALSVSGLTGVDNTITQYLALLKLCRLVRLYRIKQLFEILKYTSKVSLLHLTLIRNFSAAFAWTHFAACAIYFIAKQYDFPNKTWIGEDYASLSNFQRYSTSLYWSVVTFTTVGYGDFSPVNSAEQICAMIYMMMNIVFMAYFIGSITLLVVKNDEKTGMYRDALRKLTMYTFINDFNPRFHRRLKSQLKLDFSNREISDELVLHNFPSAVRRKVLRKLYLSSLMSTKLLQSIQEQFIDAFLGACCVEIFSPGEEFLQQGSVSTDLYFLVSGTIELCREFHDGYRKAKRIHPGEFINEIGFFTESLQSDTVTTLTVCKTLTMSRSAYKKISEKHPCSAGRVLQNLASKFEKPTSSDNLDIDSSSSTDMELDPARSLHETTSNIYNEAAISLIHDLVKKHVEKQKDDQTTIFLFAASRNAVKTITYMCEDGFDPNSADYDSRTALMVSSMKGNIETVTKLLKFGAKPNLRDMHGTTALLEAVKNGHEEIVDLLLQYNATLGIDEVEASNLLCAAVFRRDFTFLRRLLHANIDINAADYDKRTAIHIAAAEGDISLLKMLVELGADLTVLDRWDNSIKDEATRVNSTEILEYLSELEQE